MELLEFYPTPRILLDKIFAGVNWWKINTVLEPSAGKGDIAKYLLSKTGHGYENVSHLDIDCVELEPTLRNILKGDGLRVVHDNFLTYDTWKAYDLIVMNPPFSCGYRHLAKALSMQERTGGDVVCILNAETIRNPYSIPRKELVRKLVEIGASIEYMQQEFSSAERRTDVEIAVIKAHFEKPSYDSDIFNELKTKKYSEYCSYEKTDLAPQDIIENMVSCYNLEIEAGIKLINEYEALCSKFSIINKNYDNILHMEVAKSQLSINGYVEQVRMKYWETLFKDKRITGNMTSNLIAKYSAMVNELKGYEFSVYNIKTLQLEMSRHLVEGVEECIIKLFDELSYQHSWYPEMQKNIRYYNGWATNKAWIVGKKVIIPFNGFGTFTFNTDVIDVWKAEQKLSDIEKALNYLDGGITENVSIGDVLKEANEKREYKNLQFKYFKATFYKKGTCHLVFDNEELLKKFNIFGSRKKGWLPQTYGRKKYSEMEKEEKTVIDEFEGEASYNKTMCNTNYYLFDASKSMMLIEEKTA